MSEIGNAGRKGKKDRFISLHVRMETRLMGRDWMYKKINQGDSSTGFFSVPSGLGG